MLVMAFLASGFIATAQPPKGNAVPGDTYGAKVKNPAAATDIAALPVLLNDGQAHNTKIKAKVLDVCPKKGCWMKLAVNDTTTAFVNMKDYEFFIPTAAIGKTVVIDGEAKMKTTSVEELKHYAKDAKKSPEEIANITAPKKEIRIMASGVTVVN